MTAGRRSWSAAFAWLSGVLCDVAAGGAGSYLVGMHASVRLVLPDGSRRTLGPGDLIGRLWSCALFLDDARVSEAHAMVSMRGEELRLLALRGRFTVDDRAVTEVVLAAGQRLALARGLELRVEHVEVPDDVLGLEGPGLPRQVLLGVVSVVCGLDGFSLVPGHADDAAAWVWNTGEGWQVRLRGGDAPPLEAGDTFQVEGKLLQAVAVPLRHASGEATMADAGLLDPITVIAKWSTVRIERGNELLLVVDGVGARVLTELALIDGPAPWGTIAAEIWRKEKDMAALRHRWDAVITRLRRRLREGRVRIDLIRADGLGNISLHLNPDDKLVVEA